MDRTKTEVIVLRESWLNSIISDLVTLSTFVAMIGLGVYLESAAMQWIGGILWLLAMFGRVARKAAADGRMSVDQAIEHLQKLQQKG